MENNMTPAVVEKGETIERYFDGAEIKGISIETASAQTKITCTNGSKPYVRFTAGSSKMKFSAELNGGVLTVIEKPANLFGFGAIRSGELIIELPEKQYDEVALRVASGRAEASGLTSEKFSADLASGEIDMNIFASEINVTVASGKALFSRFTEKTADRINIRTASGVQEFRGFASRETDISNSSGKVIMSGVTGDVKADIASGSLELTYAEWNGMLRLKVLSGKADVTLPTGSGADVDFERLSGSMAIDLDDTHVSLDRNSGGIYGGSNVQKLRADVTSGSVSVHN